MAKTTIGGKQITDASVQRADLDTSTVGQAVVTKIIQGTGVTINSTGADSGTGDVTINASSGSIATTTNILKGNNAGGAIAATPSVDFALPSDAFINAILFG